MKYDYLVLDFNGTIIDDVDLCLNILNHLLEERDYKKVSLEEYKHIFTFPIKKYYINAGFDLEKRKGRRMKFLSPFPFFVLLPFHPSTIFYFFRFF